MKSKKTAYKLFFFFWPLGVHKFYLEKKGMGILYIFTIGLFGFGWIYDLFTLGRQVDQYNKMRQTDDSIPGGLDYTRDKASDQLVKELKNKGYSNEEINDMARFGKSIAQKIYNEKNRKNS